MTNKRPSKRALLKAASMSAPRKVEVEQAMLKALRATKARAIAKGARVTDDITALLSPREVKEEALQIHRARGGSTTPTQEDYAAAINTLKIVQAEIIYQAAAPARDVVFADHLQQLMPLLKPKELAENRLTFARAVAITLGHHSTTKDYKKPSRWIKYFHARYEKAGAPNPYRDTDAKDYLTLKEFARMHFLNAWHFKTKRSITKGRFTGILPKKKPAGHSSEGDGGGTKNSHKKVLVRESGHPSKPSRRKPQKRRTPKD
jgi:hypothetical protein